MSKHPEQNVSAELADWLRLTLIPGLGSVGQRKLLQAFGLPLAIFKARGNELRAVIGDTLAAQLADHANAPSTNATIETALDWASEAGNHILTLADSAYPQALLTSNDPPPLLYAKGRVELLQQTMLSVVGSRNATRQGELDAEAFATHLSHAGLAVVSGLALGIDAAAHRGGLKGKGSTIAVIGTGIDRIYPARNADLARHIAEQGVILSEFPLGTGPLAHNFPRRNRIIAGLGLGCLVIEAAERSGSLITARLAAEAGREVFAIPGSIHSALARGCHKLIRQGAKLVESAEDILEELKWEAVVSPISIIPAETTPLGDEELKLINMLGDVPCDLETLGERSGLTPEVLLAMLLPMELDGRIASLPGGRYQKLG
ncbi:MAG TPA: DNA-processing protein DprA [Rhodocyclaceae bacterium]|nr:DNA-processing protein DprA [Rhodocyclaceae bacterium]